MDDAGVLGAVSMVVRFGNSVDLDQAAFDGQHAAAINRLHGRSLVRDHGALVVQGCASFIDQTH